MLNKSITLKLENGQDLTVELTPLKFSEYTKFANIDDEGELVLKLIYASTGKDAAWLETVVNPNANPEAFAGIRDACFEVNKGFFALYIGAKGVRRATY